MTELSKQEEQEILMRNLSGLTNIRKFTKYCSFDWLEDLNSKLSSIIEERREEETLRKMELEEKEERRLKVIEYIKELGLEPEDVNVSVFDAEPKYKKKKKSKHAPAKYRFTDPETGKIETWTGVGRQKSGLKLLLAQGHELNEFLIQPELLNEENSQF